QLRCLEAATGKRVWQDLTATGAGNTPQRWANAFLVPHEDRFFLFNEKGELVIAKLSPAGYTEVDRARILAPTSVLQANKKFGLERRVVVWSPPAFANRNLYARNDREVVSVSLAAE